MSAILVGSDRWLHLQRQVSTLQSVLFHRCDYMQITQNMERSYSSDACKLHEWTVYTDVMWNGIVKQDVNKGQWLCRGCYLVQVCTVRHHNAKAHRQFASEFTQRWQTSVSSITRFINQRCQVLLTALHTSHHIISQPCTHHWPHHNLSSTQQLSKYTLSQQTHQLYNGRVRHYKNRFRWYLNGYFCINFLDTYYYNMTKNWLKNH